jgi:F-type H+-transporting ATPase subunit delta
MSAVASRYARALVEVILEQKIDAEVARQQLRSIVEAVHESDELRRVWDSPAISPEQKRAVLDAIANQMGTVKPIRNFIAVLIDHRRIGMLDDMLRQFETELDAQLGFTEVEVSSARPLSAEEKRELESRVESMTGKKVRTRYVTDPELAGRSDGARRQHDLRRLSARATGEDAAGVEPGVAVRAGLSRLRKKEMKGSFGTAKAVPLQSRVAIKPAQSPKGGTNISPGRKPWVGVGKEAESRRDGTDS